MNRTCPSKWRIKKPFITCTRAGAAKKAAGCGGEARGASLSYLEPFPVNLGPPFVVVSRTRMHTLARTANALTHVHARVWWLRATSGAMLVCVSTTLHLAAKTRRCEPNNHFSSLADAPAAVTNFCELRRLTCKLVSKTRRYFP